MLIHLSKKGLISAALLSCTLAYGQQKTQDKNREVSVNVQEQNGIRTTSISVKSGDGQLEEFSWDGDQIPVLIQQELDELGIDFNIEENALAEPSVDLPSIRTEKKEVKVIIKDGSGEKVMEWNGTEDMPKEIQEKIKDLERLDNEPGSFNKIIIRSGNGEEKVLQWNGDDMPEEVKNQLEASELSAIVQSDTKEKPQVYLGLAMAHSLERKIENGIESSKNRITIAEVVSGSPAEKAGLQVGDEITAIDQKKVQDVQQVLSELKGHAPGDVIALTVMREEKLQTLNVTLSEKTIIANGEKREMIIEKKITINPKPETGQLNQRGLVLEELKIHPNPTNESLNISFRSQPGALHIRMSDLSGKLLWEKKIDAFNGVYQDEINLQPFPSGTMMLHIEQDGKTHSETVIKQ